MGIKKGWKILMLLLIASMVIAGCSGKQQPPAQSGESKEGEAESPYPVMKMVVAHQAPVDDPRHLGSMEIKRVIEEESGGRITVDVFPAGQIGGGREMVEAAQGGAVQIVVIPPAYMGGFQPLYTLLDIPYLLPSDPKQAREVIDGPAGQALHDTLEEVNMVGLDLWDSAYKHFTANKPLRKLEDFKGLKFRVMPSDILLKMIEALGANAVTFDYSEVFTALQTGAIDGQEASATSIYNMKFHEVQDYLMMTYHIKSEFLVLGSKTWFDGLNKETQDLIRKAVKAGGDVNDASKIKQEEESTRLIVEEGCTKIDLTDEEIQGLREATLQPCLDIYLKTNGERGQKLVDLFLSEMERVKK
jgi:tripartite ATP-independent transporter DctP family solute receptor